MAATRDHEAPETESGAPGNGHLGPYWGKRREPQPEPAPAAGSADDGGESGDGGSDGESADEAATAPRRKRVRTWVEWGLVIGGALLVALIIRATLFQAFWIPTASMEPTLQEGDRVLVNKLSYRLHDVNRGDIVVFERPDSASSGSGDDVKDLIKRVIALEGEMVEDRDGVVYIDGRRLDEPYVPEGTVTTDLPPTSVPDGHVFVMGDNRDDSYDSRGFGAIDEDLIVGRAFVRIYPLDDIGGL